MCNTLSDGGMEAATADIRCKVLQFKVQTLVNRTAHNMLRGLKCLIMQSAGRRPALAQCPTFQQRNFATVKMTHDALPRLTLFWPQHSHTEPMLM